MKAKRFSVEQIVAVLMQAEVEAPVSDITRHLGSAELTSWKGDYFSSHALEAPFISIGVGDSELELEVQEENLLEEFVMGADRATACRTPSTC